MAKNWKQFNLLDLTTVSENKISIFSGEKDYISTGDIDLNKIVGRQKVTYQNRPSRAALLVDEGDVLFAKMKGTVKVLMGSDELKDKIFSTGFYVLKPKENLVKEFLYFYLLTEYFNQQKDLLCAGATMSGLNNSGLKKIKINLPVNRNGMPDILEQKRIISILLQAEDLLKKRNEANDYTNELIFSTFFKILGDPIQNTKNWPTVRLDDLCKIDTGSTPPREQKEFYGDAVEWIKSDNIIETEIYPLKAKEGLSELGLKNATYVEVDSILMTCIAGSLNSIGNVCMTNRRVAFNQQINSLTPTKKTNPIFLYVLLKLIKPRLHKNASHVLKYIINKSNLERIEVINPPLELQNRFAEQIKSLQSFKSKQQESTQEIKKLFSSLVSRTLIGQL